MFGHINAYFGHECHCAPLRSGDTQRAKVPEPRCAPFSSWPRRSSPRNAVLQERAAGTQTAACSQRIRLVPLAASAELDGTMRNAGQFMDGSITPRHLRASAWTMSAGFAQKAGSHQPHHLPPHTPHALSSSAARRSTLAPRASAATIRMHSATAGPISTTRNAARPLSARRG